VGGALRVTLRRLASAVGVCLVAAAGLQGPARALVSATAPAPGSFTQHTYSSAFGSRAYWLYMPSGSWSGPLPMVVFLHGCNETAEQAATATHFDPLADELGFAVVYPQQNVTTDSSAPLADGNGIGCWNWFLPEDQVAGSGEPAVLAGLTQQAATLVGADPSRIYVEGISAGADMAVILGATYPRLFAAVGVLAGCAYRTCSDVSGAATNAAMGSAARVVPMFIENGTADTLNNMAMATGLLTSWIGADNMAGSADNMAGSAGGDSVSPVPASVATYGTDQTPQPLSGDACVHNDSLTCPGGVVGFQGTYPYTVAKYTDSFGCDVLELWAIHGMEHAHPDAPGDGPYTDPLGPDVTAASYKFFSQHSLSSSAEPGGCNQ
jgi:poly(hydroxyalkanoate) depolymerase family esterase